MQDVHSTRVVRVCGCAVCECAGQTAPVQPLARAQRRDVSPCLYERIVLTRVSPEVLLPVCEHGLVCFLVRRAVLTCIYPGANVHIAYLCRS